MRMGQGVRTGLEHGGITCVLQTQFSRLNKHQLNMLENAKYEFILKFTKTG